MATMAAIVLILASITQAYPQDESIPENPTISATMTPVLEKPPETDWVTVDTPYGSVLTSKEELKTVGLEEFIADHIEFCKELEKLKAMEEKTVVPDQNSDEELHPQTIVVDTSYMSPNYIEDCEWCGFNLRNPSHRPDRLYGVIYMSEPYNTGQTNFHCYHEREIRLNINDVIEFIAHYLPDGTRNIWMAIFDGNKSESREGINGVTAPVNYYFEIDSEKRCYIMRLYNTANGQSVTRYYNDTDDFSSYITDAVGSAELYHYGLSKTFTLWTDIIDEWTRVGGTYYRPNEIFKWAGYSLEEPYAEINDACHPNFIFTQHETEYPNPGDLMTNKSGSLSGTGASYTFSVSGLPVYTVVMAGNEIADFELYAKWGSPPTTSNYDARSASATSLEYFTTSGSGTLYIMVHSFSGSGTFKCWVISGTKNLESGRKTGSLSGTGSTATFSTTSRSFHVGWAFNSGPDGSNFDLYIKWNSPPTTSNYDACGTSSWPEEGVYASGSGILHFMVHSKSGSGEYATLALIF